MSANDEENKERKVLVVGGSRGYGKLAALVSIASGLSPTMFYSAMARFPEPKPAKKLSQADFDRMESAESKRNRRIHRAKEQSK